MQESALERSRTLSAMRRASDWERIMGEEAMNENSGCDWKLQISERRVLSTLIWRKRAGTAPWDTGASCWGCPLPQLGEPPRKYSSCPQSPSQAFQKSTVFP